MEITSSTVYWVFQLDYIHEALIVILLACVLGGAPAIVRLWVATKDEYIKPPTALLSTILIVGIFLVAGGFKVFLPLTRTAIAMYTIPKLLNSQAMYTLEGDAKELYKLGVERLKSELKEEIRK